MLKLQQLFVHDIYQNVDTFLLRYASSTAQLTFVYASLPHDLLISR